MKKAILFSSILHLLILGLFIISCVQIFRPSSSPINYKNIIPVYFVTDSNPQSSVRKDAQQAHLNSKLKNIQARDAHVGRLYNDDHPMRDIRHPSMDSAHLHKSSDADFPSLLHSLIQNEVEIPNGESNNGNQPKSVQIEFLAFPDGHLEHVHIIQSSNNFLFDQAALDAVHSVQPISFAHQFLKQPQTFQVQIVFRSE